MSKAAGRNVPKNVMNAVFRLLGSEKVLKGTDAIVDDALTCAHYIEELQMERELTKRGRGRGKG